MGAAAIFLDRDGVLNENRPDHVKSWDEFRFLPGTLDALRQLSQTGLSMFVITNQGAIGQGKVSQRTVEEIHERMLFHLQAVGVRISGVRVCPHTADDGCRCRKPEPGLILDVAKEFDVDLSRSVFVGDAGTDILAGHRARCNTVLVLTGRGSQAMQAMTLLNIPKPTAIATDLLGAVPTIRRLVSEPARIERTRHDSESVAYVAMS
jgi:D-glycero-D-manno-heptose 1,7-bisphosphate phosphatase